MSKTWHLIRKEHRRLWQWWCAWWLLVLSDAVLRYTHLAYFGDHGFELALQMFEGVFPLLAMGMSLLIIGLSNVEEAPVPTLAFGQGLPLSSTRIFLSKTVLLATYLVLIPAGIEWLVCLEQGFGVHAKWLVLDWIVDRIPILAVAMAVAAIAGNFGKYVVMLAMALAVTFLVSFLVHPKPVVPRPGFTYVVVGSVLIGFLALIYYQFRTKRSIHSLISLWFLLLTLGGLRAYCPKGFHVRREQAEYVAAEDSRLIDSVKVVQKPFAHLERSLGRRVALSTPSQMYAEIDYSVIVPDPTWVMPRSLSSWSWHNQDLQPWILSQGIVPIDGRSPEHVFQRLRKQAFVKVADAWDESLQASHLEKPTPIRISGSKPYLAAEIPLKVGAAWQDDRGLLRIAGISWGSEFQIDILRREMPPGSQWQRLAPPTNERLDFVLFNRSHGVGVRLDPDGRVVPAGYQWLGDWRQRSLSNEGSSISYVHSRSERRASLSESFWASESTTLAVVRWHPLGNREIELDAVKLYENLALPLGPGEMASLLKWPDSKDKEAVRAYLSKLLQKSNEGQRLNQDRGMLSAEFGGVGGDNLDALISIGLTLASDDPRKQAIAGAIQRLARSDHRDLIFDTFSQNLDLLALILDRGWLDDGSEAVLRAAESNPFKLKSAWVKTLLQMDDPRAAECVWKRVTLGPWSPEIYDLVVEHGIDLRPRIDQAWKAAHLIGDDRALLLGLRAGHPAALDKLQSIMRHHYYWGKVEKQVVALMWKRSPFRGEMKEFSGWFEENGVRLVYDSAQQKYIWKEDAL